MAQDLSTLNPEWWSREMGMEFKKKLVARNVASFKEAGKLKVGDTVNRPYVTDGSDHAYTRDTAVTINEFTPVNEQLTINDFREFSFYVDDVDDLQNDYDWATRQASRAAYKLHSYIDFKVLGDYENFASGNTIDDGDIGGTDGNAITMSATNPDDVVEALKVKMGEADVPMEGDTFLVCDPEMAGKIELLAVNSGFNVADSAFKNGYAGDFMGVRIYVSNNLTNSVQLNIATEPTADDTFTIAGVTWTFKAAPSAAGEIDLSGTAATTVDDMVAAINNDNGYAAGAGAATTYYEVSAANRLTLKNKRISATDNTTYILVKGAGKLVVSETLTAGADVFSKNTTHNIGGKMRGTDLVVQKEPDMSIREVDDRRGSNFIALTVFGYKTFWEGGRQLFDVQTLKSV